MNKAQPLSKLLVRLSKGAKSETGAKSSVDLLNTHGFVRQVGSGIYDLLPMGLRVQKNIANIVRKNLDKSECTELELSTLVNPSLWQSSGRLTDHDLQPESQSEFTFTENKKQLLAPTAEEQITTLVGSTSYRQLPLSLYQISRKYRNELRPRGGLLRTREFLMKDLYTFDENPELAADSYERIKSAYHNIFTEIGVPFVRADADSGDMGGDLSHEYHYISQSGEDELVQCHKCDYVANSEKAASKIAPSSSSDLRAVEIDGATIPDGRELSPHLLQHAKKSGSKLVDLSLDPSGVPLIKPEKGDVCVSCDTPLNFDLAIEIGHTFYLGDRYSKPLKALVTPRQGPSVPISMGCYGIGVTRIIGAVAEANMDDHGLIWPKSIAPFQCAVVSKNIELSKTTADYLSSQGIDTVYEDRTTQIGHAMRSFRECGIPYTIVLGKSYDNEGLVEVLERKTGGSIKCSLEELPSVLSQSE